MAKARTSTKLSIRLFTPLESMNPVFLEDPKEVLVKHHGRTFAEVKEDGYRLQIHKKGAQVRAYTRTLHPVHLEVLPEIQASLKNLPTCILDSELLGHNKIGTAGFKVVQRRFRHTISPEGVEDYLRSGLVEEAPLTLRVFDTLYWEGQALLDRPLTERRRFTESILEDRIQPSILHLPTTVEDLLGLFKGLTGQQYEGLVCKRPDSLYLPGQETTDWIKLKRSETFDLVVLGVYLNEKKQLSKLLCGTYNPVARRFETLAKVNPRKGRMDKDLLTRLQPHWVQDCPGTVLLNPALLRPEKRPDYFLPPSQSVVVEVAAMDVLRGAGQHSCGLEDGKSYSLRISTLQRIRDDKTPVQATTTEKVQALYLQSQETA